MKRMLGIILAIVFLVAPAITLAQVDAAAGSMKFGAHVDVGYYVSNESNKDPDADEIGWRGYDTVNLQDVIIDLNGKVGDRVSYRILQALVVDAWDGGMSAPAPGPPAIGPIANIGRSPYTPDLPLEAWINIKIIDQLGFKFGKQITPTLIANTGAHLADVIHTVNSPLIAQNSFGLAELRSDSLVTALTFLRLPLSVTGASAIISFSGVEIVYTQFDEWLQQGGAPAASPLYVYDNGYDSNKTKGGNLAVGYNGQVGPGKLNARGFYFDEDTELWPGDNLVRQARFSGWGGGVMYNADKFFAGGEYATATLKYDSKDLPLADINSNTYSGYYLIAGGRFSSIEVVYRLDSMDYNNYKKGDLYAVLAAGDVDPASVDNEIWHTIGVNYLINDQTTVLVNYVIKSPERPKVYDGASWEKIKLPNMNEFSIMLEVDAL